MLASPLALGGGGVRAAPPPARAAAGALLTVVRRRDPALRLSVCTGLCRDATDRECIVCARRA